MLFPIAHGHRRDSADGREEIARRDSPRPAAGRHGRDQEGPIRLLAPHGHRGPCGNTYVREEELIRQFGELLKQVRIPTELAGKLATVLRESQTDKEKFVRTSMLRLQQQQMLDSNPPPLELRRDRPATLRLTGGTRIGSRSLRRVASRCWIARLTRCGRAIFRSRFVSHFAALCGSLWHRKGKKRATS